MPRSSAAVSDAVDRPYARRRVAPFERQRLRQELPPHLVLSDHVAQPTLDDDDDDDDLEVSRQLLLCITSLSEGNES